MAVRLRILSALSLLLLAACSGKAAPTEQKVASDSEPPKSITADISGDYAEHFSAKGGSVSVGGGGSIDKGTARFTIGGRNEGATQTTDLTIGFITQFSGFSVGKQQDCRGASVRLLRGGDETAYDEGHYVLFYETRPDAPPIAHVTFSKADKLPSGNPYLVRYHLVGTFDFLAAYAPEPSEACAQEAVAHSPRHPGYKADLCDAKKIVVRGSFDIIDDLPTSFFE